VLYINFQLSQNKRKEQSDSKRRKSPTTTFIGPGRTKFLAALLRNLLFRDTKRW